MKLLFFFTHKISETAGGVERVVFHMRKELIKRGYEIDILYLKPSNSKSSVTEQFQLPSEKGDSKVNENFIASFIKSRHYNLAFNFGAIFNRSSQSFMEACSKGNLPIISIYHNTLDWILWLNPITSIFMNNKPTRSLIRNVYAIYQKMPFSKHSKYFSRKSSASIVLAECYKADYQRFIDSKPKDLRSIYNPLILPKSYSKKEPEEKYNEILFVGRLDTQKNVAELVKIWANSKVNNWSFIIVGDGPLKKQIEQLIEIYNLKDSVRLIGHTDHPEIYYKRAKIFVMTSKYEGFPMTLLECQTFKCVPIIYDSYPAAKEIIEDGVNGFLIPYGKPLLFSHKLKKLISNEQLLYRMASVGHLMAEKYNLNIIIDEWEDVIRKHSK